MDSAGLVKDIDTDHDNRMVDPGLSLQFLWETATGSGFVDSSGIESMHVSSQNGRDCSSLRSISMPAGQPTFSKLLRRACKYWLNWNRSLKGFLQFQCVIVERQTRTLSRSRAYELRMRVIRLNWGICIADSTEARVGSARVGGSEDEVVVGERGNGVSSAGKGLMDRLLSTAFLLSGVFLSDILFAFTWF